MLGLTNGELFLVVFLAGVLITARWWPRLGSALASRLAGGQDDSNRSPGPAPSNADD